MRQLRDPHFDVLLGIEYGADASLPFHAGWSVDVTQSLEIPQIEQAHSHIWVALTQEPELAVLAGDEPLPHRRQLEIQVVLGKVEIGGDEFDRSSIPPPPYRKCGRLVRPTQAIERQESRQLHLGRMSEAVVIRLE